MDAIQKKRDTHIELYGYLAILLYVMLLTST